MGELFDPNDTGFVTLPHFVTVTRVLASSGGEPGIAPSALDGLFALAADRALRLFASADECCAHLQGRPPGTYCVSVGGSVSSDCALCIVEPKEGRRATKGARETEPAVV